MSAENQLQRDISPYVLTDTSNLSREAWLEFRRRGIGGSDVAALMGISPFWTARDLYYDKLNIAPLEPDESNWVAMEMGNLLEELVSRIFAKRPVMRSLRSRRCSITRSIRSCWQMWIILCGSRTAALPFWR